MANPNTTSDEPSQLDKFKEAARQLETDDDPERFKERLAALVKAPVVRDNVPGRRKGA